MNQSADKNNERAIILEDIERVILDTYGFFPELMEHQVLNALQTILKVSLNAPIFLPHNKDLLDPLLEIYHKYQASGDVVKTAFFETISACDRTIRNKIQTSGKISPSLRK